MDFIASSTKSAYRNKINVMYVLLFFYFAGAMYITLNKKV